MGVVPILRKNLSQSAKESLRSYLWQLHRDGIDKLPPEIELAKKLSVSRGTTREALDVLEKEGLLLRIHGRGTFLNPNGFHVKVNVSSLLEFGTVIKQSGYEASSSLISVEKDTASDKVSKALHCEIGSDIYRIVRVYYADDTPAIYSLAFIPLSIFDNQPAIEIWQKHSNFEVIKENAGRIIIRDQVEISAITREVAEREIEYAIDNMPSSLLRLEGCGFDQDNNAVILGSAYYNTDYVRFTLFRELE